MRNLVLRCSKQCASIDQVSSNWPLNILNTHQQQLPKTPINSTTENVSTSTIINLYVSCDCLLYMSIYTFYTFLFFPAILTPPKKNSNSNMVPSPPGCKVSERQENLGSRRIKRGSNQWWFQHGFNMVSTT